MTTAMAPTFGPSWGDPDEDCLDVHTATNLRMLGLFMPAGAAILQVMPAIGPLCPLRRTTGVPCPLCGMTTGVNALARGDLAGALAANPLAPALVLLVLLAWVFFLVGRPTLPVRTRTLGRTMAALLPGLWLFQLHRYDLI